MDEAARKDTARAFRQAVNMSPAALRRWLASGESRAVGMRPGGEKIVRAGQGEAVGHAMGRAILALLEKKSADYTDGDYETMRKVVGYVHRHGKQRPQGDVTDTRWRRSLMNWGHDPLR